MPDPQKHSDDRNWIESIGRKIPGFRGYLERGYRREADHLLRESIAERLQRSKSGIDDYLRQLVNAAQLDGLTEIERIRTRLDTLIGKIRAQVRGASGFFDFVRVDEEKLDQAYALDMQLHEQTESLAEAIEALSTPKGGDDSPAAIAADLIRKIDDAETQLECREDLLQGVGE
ncbi:MAG: hypothetical protein ACI8UO_006754 [Verrucomicrobiales bacterium]